MRRKSAFFFLFFFFEEREPARLAEITAKYSPNSGFPNTSSGEVGGRCSPGAHQRRVSEFSCQYCVLEIF